MLAILSKQLSQQTRSRAMSILATTSTSPLNSSSDAEEPFSVEPHHEPKLSKVRAEHDYHWSFSGTRTLNEEAEKEVETDGKAKFGHVKLSPLALRKRDMLPLGDEKESAHP